MTIVETVHYLKGMIVTYRNRSKHIWCFLDVQKPCYTNGFIQMFC